MQKKADFTSTGPWGLAGMRKLCFKRTRTLGFWASTWTATLWSWPESAWNLSARVRF
jgi:hypothetical protein